MKLVNKNAKANLILWRFAFCAMIAFLYSCGSGGGGGDDGGGDGSGNLSFSLKFEEPDGNFPSALNAALSPSGDICVDYGIKTISVEVFDSSNTAVASDRWPCSTHKGTIIDVPTGSGISLEVVGTVDGDDGESNDEESNDGESNDWHGKIGNLSVYPDENTDAGEVDMYYIGDDKTPPGVVSTDPSNNGSDIPRNADITCTFSENIVHASVNEEVFALNFGTETFTGTVTYNLMDLTATFKPDSNLDYCTTYTATISKKVEDRAGNKMAEDFSWSFTTLPDDNKSKYKWYKDSDKDKYSDGTEKISCDKPGDDYYLAPDLLSTSGDCNDNDAIINPEANEVCDGQDNDCDGGADEDLSRVTSCGVGACASNKGTETCTDGQWGDDTCNPFAGAIPEICDGQDNNCNGSVDEGLSRDTSCGVGVCAGNTGIETCTDGQWGDDTCNPFAGATPEICDDQDNDCDGGADEDLSRVTSCGEGACAGNTGEETCTAGQWGENTCDPLAGATPEIPCDTIDQDCDGEDLCISETFDFEELTPTYVFGQPGGRPGELTSLSSTRSGITIDIFREEALGFDTVDHTSLLEGGIPGYGSVSLDPFADTSDSAFIVNFSIPVSSVSVDMGDYNTTFDGPVQDDDVLMLEAYSLAGASGALLDSDQIDLPDTPSEIRTWSSETLSVTPASGCIESIRMIGGSKAGPSSVFYDNIVVEAPCEDLAGPNNPPAFLIIPPFEVKYGQEIQFTVTAEDPDLEDTLTINADLSDLPAASGATFIDNNDRTGTFRWTPYAADFPKQLSSLTFLFGEFGGNLNMEINGDFRNFNNFSELNGSTIGGASVSVSNGSGQDSGEVSISGATIDSFAIGGQELWIDDFCYQTECVDFEDLEVGTPPYPVGSSFIDSGANIFANPFTWSSGTETSSGTAIVENSGRAGGSGNEMRCNNINLDFLFGYTVLFAVTDNGQPPLSDAMRKSFTWLP